MTPSQIKATRELLTPPGDTLLDTIENIGMTQAELALRTGRSVKHINEIIQGKAPILSETALQLEMVLGISRRFWLNLEQLHQEELQNLEIAEKNQREKEWASVFPWKWLISVGAIVPNAPEEKRVEKILSFFSVASQRAWEICYIEKLGLEVNFRKDNRSYKATDVASWLRLGEIRAKNLNVQTYDRKGFIEILDEVIALIPNASEDIPHILQSKSADVGVALVYIPCVPGSAISGAARWLGDTPLIEISDHRKTYDRFWFNFFHEAAHILKHGKKDIFLEELDGFILAEDKEKEADRFASDKLLKPSIWNELVARYPKFSKEVILEMANELHTHPSIVVGRLQNDGLIQYSSHKDLVINVNLFREPQK